MMEIVDTRSYRDREGLLVDRVEVGDSPFNEIEFRQLDDEGRMVLKARDGDGTTRSFVLQQLPEKYIGLEPIENDRRDVPNDLQDVLFQLGYTIRPRTIEVE